MANTVFIRIHSDYSVDWALTGDANAILNQPSTALEQLTDICHGKKVIVFIPGDMVNLSSHVIPVRSKQKILQAAPFAMEDDLIGDIGDFHFAIPARTPTKNIPICAIARSSLISLLSLLKKYQLHPEAIIADTFALPWQHDEWTILLEDNKTTVRTDQFAGFTVDTIDLNDYLDIAIQESGDAAPTKLSVIDNRSNQEQPLESLIPDSLSVQNNTPQGTAIDVLADNFQENDAINLLQGDYAVRHMRNQSLKKWYPVAAVFMLLLLVKLVDGVLEYNQLSNEISSLDQQINQIFRQSLPDVKRIVNPRAQMQQRLASLKEGNQNNQAGFFTHFSNTAKALKNDNSIIIKSLNYRSNRLDIELSIKDLQALEKLKQSISQTGSNVEIRSAAVQGKQVSARLRIQGGAS